MNGLELQAQAKDDPALSLSGETMPAMAASSPRSVLQRGAARTPLGRPLGHWLMLFALVVMWGSSFALTDIALSSVSAESVVAARIVIAGLVLVALVMATGRRIPLDGRLWGFFAVMAVLGNCLPYWLITWGQETVDSGLAGILMAVMPLVTLVLAHFFVAGERMNWAKAAGFALGFIGIIVLMGPEALLKIEGHGSALLAELAIIGGAACYAANTIVARHCPLRDGLIAAAGTALAANLVLLPVTGGELSANLQELDLPAVWAIALLGVVSTALAPVLYFRVIRLAGPTFLSLINYLIPVWAVFVGMMFLGETPAWTALAALALILGGIAVSQSRSAREAVNLSLARSARTR